MNHKQLKRMLELSDIKTIKENRNDLSSIELVKKASNGKVYSVVRENRKYYIKTSDKVENLTESDFDYIGGVHNKPKFSYRSFEDATRHLNSMFEDFNRSNGGVSTNMLESDTHLLAETRFVLKQPKKVAPAPAPDLDFSGGDDFDFGNDDGGTEGGDTEGGDFDFGGDTEGGDTEGDDFDFGDDEGGDTESFGDDSEDIESFDDGEDTDGDDPIKAIQKTTGQLGQQIRDTEDLSSDTQKWVAKSVLAALDLNDMDSSDKNDLIKTINSKDGDDTDVINTEDDNSGEDYDSHMSDDEFNYDEMSMTDKERSNLDPSIASDTDAMYGPNDEYDSYMDDTEDDGDGLCSHCQGTGCSHCAGLGFVDETSEDNPRIGGDEDENIDDLLLDDEENDYIEPKAKLRADRDMSKHYNKPAAPGYDDQPTEKWRGHKIADDMNFDATNPYDSYMDDSEFDSIEAELGLPTATPSVDETDYENTSIDSKGNFDDSLEDSENVKYDSYMNDETDPTMSPGPAPARPAPTKEPGTKPGKPDTDRPARPSKRPFTPPPHIRPGEEPGPKARNGRRRGDLDITFE